MFRKILVANRGEIVEVEVIRQGVIERRLRAAQLLVLQLQLDLVYLQFVKHRAGRVGRHSL